MEALKPKDFGTSRVDIIGDTAFIYFENFEETGQESAFYYHLPDENLYDVSTFALFYDAFAKIKQAPQVKKVVIDLSNNGGGNALPFFAQADGLAKIIGEQPGGR